MAIRNKWSPEMRKRAYTRHDDGNVYTPYITRNGKRIYHPKGGLFVFPDKRKKR